MGTWIYNVLDNDEALDLLGEFNESMDISILEMVLDAVSRQKSTDSIEAPLAQRAIAAAKIISDLNEEQISTAKKDALLRKSDKALRRILETSELKGLWADSPEYDAWTKAVESLLIG